MSLSICNSSHSWLCNLLPYYSGRKLYPPHLFDSFNTTDGMLFLFIVFLVPMYTITYDLKVTLFWLRSIFCLHNTIVTGLIVSDTALDKGKAFNNHINPSTNDITMNLYTWFMEKSDRCICITTLSLGWIAQSHECVHPWHKFILELAVALSKVNVYQTHFTHDMLPCWILWSHIFDSKFLIPSWFELLILRRMLGQNVIQY